MLRSYSKRETSIKTVKVKVMEITIKTLGNPLLKDLPKSVRKSANILKTSRTSITTN